MSDNEVMGMMDIKCDWCGRTGSFVDSVEAKDSGWYTHRMTASTLSIKPPDVEWDEWKISQEIPEAISMGYICPLCVPAENPE